MTERPNSPISPMSDAELETALLDLGRELAPIQAPDLALSVRVRIERGEAAALAVPTWPGPSAWAERLGLGIGRPFRRGLVLALAAVLLIGGIAAAIGFGLPGLRVIILGPAPSPSAVEPSQSAGSPLTSPSPTPAATPPTLESLDLGDPVERATAAAAVGYGVKLPTLPELGQPLGIYARGDPPTARLSALYAANPSFPAGANAPLVAGRSVAIIVMQFPGATEAGFLKKILEPGTTIQDQMVAGHEGFWISGKPHDLIYVGPDGQDADDRVRIVGNVLAWNDGELTFRIEGAQDLAAALRIAASMR